MVGVIATVVTVPALPPPVTIYIVGYFFVVSTVLRDRIHQSVTPRARRDATSDGGDLAWLDPSRHQPRSLPGLTPLAPEDSRAILQALGQLLGLELRRRVLPWLRAAADPAAERGRSPSCAHSSRAPRASRDSPRRWTSCASSSAARRTARARRRASGCGRTHTSKLRFWEDDDTTVDIEPGTHFAGRAFELQRPIFSANPIRDNPDGAADYRSREHRRRARDADHRG